MLDDHGTVYLSVTLPDGDKLLKKHWPGQAGPGNVDSEVAPRLNAPLPLQRLPEEWLPTPSLSPTIMKKNREQVVKSGRPGRACPSRSSAPVRRARPWDGKAFGGPGPGAH
jgi:hypothetical protein